MKEHTPQELTRIWLKLLGATPGLFVPISQTGRVVRTGPNLAVFRTYQELTDDPNFVERYWERLNEAPLTRSLITFSLINLSLATGPVDQNLHGRLNRTFIREEYLRKALTREAGPQPDIEFVFNRAGVLANIKALLAVSADNPEGQAPDQSVIGDLALLCNHFVAGAQFRQPKQSASDMELLAEMLPTWEIYNLRDLAYALPRVVRMIKTYLPGDDSKVITLRESIGLSPPDLRFDGLEMDDFIAIVWGIYSHEKSLQPEEVFAHPAQALFDAKTFTGQTNFPQELFERFVNSRSISIRNFRERITAGGDWGWEPFPSTVAADQFVTDTRLFKERPLLHLEDGRELVLDVHYVAELLIYGFYWQILGSFNKDQGDTFISLWGRVLELYLFDLFGYFYPETSGILSKDISFDGGQIDAMLDLGSEIILFEFKASLMTQRAKGSRDIKLLEGEITKKFIENQKGAPKALRQLANAATAIRDGRLRTTTKPKLVYPVFIGYEPGLESFSMNTYLQQRFREFIPRKENDVVVLPLTGMSVDEVENLLPYVQAGAVTWQVVLNERFDEDRVKALSVHQTLYDICRVRQIPLIRNRFLLEEFEKIHSEIMSKYKGEK